MLELEVVSKHQPGGVTKTKRNRRFKRRRTNDPHDETEHHRRPRSQGGRDDESNISRVVRYEHEAWHLLFDSLPATKMFERFIEFYDICGWNNGNSAARQKRATEWVRSKKSRMRQQAAWHDLFGKMKLEQIVSVINRVWIDPAYEIVLDTERVRKVKIVAKKK